MCLPCRFHANLFHLTPYDIKPDLFMLSTWNNMLSDKERANWVSLNNLPSVPASWGNRSWLDSNADPYNCFTRSGCICSDAWDSNRSSHGGRCNAVVPVKGNGLVFQNVCKEDPGMAEKWRQRPPLPQPRVFSASPVDWHSESCPWWTFS